MINFINEYLKNTKQILEKINVDNIIKTIDIISNLKKNNGRIFFRSKVVQPIVHML